MLTSKRIYVIGALAGTLGLVFWAIYLHCPSIETLFLFPLAVFVLFALPQLYIEGRINLPRCEKVVIPIHLNTNVKRFGRFSIFSLGMFTPLLLGVTAYIVLQKI